MNPLDDPKGQVIMRNKDDCAAFWQWVAKRNAHDNPRGDFIRDTRELVEAGIDPGTRIGSACNEAREEHGRLLKEFQRSTGR